MLSNKTIQSRLAISLHGATDDVRNKIMPVNRKYDLTTLLSACDYYASRKKQRIYFEYILIAGINDQLAAAPEFTKLTVKEKQTLSDTLVLTGALLVMLHSAGEKDAAMKDASISMAKAVLTQLTGSATGS